MEVISVVGFVMLAVNVIFGVFMKNVAFSKGYDDSAHAFAMCFWLGIFGGIYVIALPDLVARKNQEEIISLLESNGMIGSGVGSEELPPL